MHLIKDENGNLIHHIHIHTAMKQERAMSIFMTKAADTLTAVPVKEETVRMRQLRF